MGEVFARRLQELNNEAKESLAKALKTSSEPVLVRSAFELPSEQRAAIQRVLNETFSAEIQVRFETAPEVISGIELTTNGRKIAWSHRGLSRIPGKERRRTAERTVQNPSQT